MILKIKLNIIIRFCKKILFRRNVKMIYQQNCMTLEEIFNFYRAKIKEGAPVSFFDNQSIYTTHEIRANNKYQLSDICCLGDNQILEDDDTEHPPKEIEEMRMVWYCYGADLHSVITSALHQKPDIDNKQLVYALNYFSAHGALISFEYEEKREGKPYFNIGIFPNFGRKELEKELMVRQPNFLKKNAILEYQSGTVLVGLDRLSECTPLYYLISYKSIWALNILFLGDSWGHHLYKNSLPISPMRNPEDPPKRNGYRLVANINEFMEAFSGTDPQILENYLNADVEIVSRQEEWINKKKKSQKKNAMKNVDNFKDRAPYYVLPNDRYLSNDARQVFDLLRYLSFPIEEECFKLAGF